MDKRTLLAFLFIAIILMLTPKYLELISPKQERPTPTSPQKQTEEPMPAYDFSKEIIQKETRATETSLKMESSEEQRLVIETNLYQAELSSVGGGSFTSFILKEYASFKGGSVNLIHPSSSQNNLIVRFKNFAGDTISLKNSFLLTTPITGDTIFVLNEPKTINFETYIDDQVVQKALTFYPNRYLIDLEIDLTPISRQLISQEHFWLFWEGGLPSTEKNVKDDLNYFTGHLYQGGEISKHKAKNGRPTALKGRTDWAAIRSKYFAAAFIPRTDSDYGYIKSRNSSTEKLYSMALGFSSSNPVDCSLYLGPLEYNHIKNLNVELENIMNFGWFFIKPISHGVLYLLTSMHKFVPNYGVLLIIFSILVKILVYPLTKKSYHSTKEMQAIQPLIMDLREKYKGDPQRLNKETMKLYKEHGVNPLGGCLPMLIQMPLLFALFIVFRTTIELRGAPFVLWIKDLSAPDTILELPFTIPIYGSQVSVLPILMGVSMFIQQKSMGTQATGQQKYMSYFMTVFFLLLFNNFPSGLNLYYTLFNVLTILQQKYLVHPHTQAITPTRSKKK